MKSEHEYRVHQMTNEEYDADGCPSCGSNEDLDIQGFIGNIMWGRCDAKVGSEYCGVWIGFEEERAKEENELPKEDIGQDIWYQGWATGEDENGIPTGCYWKRYTGKEWRALHSFIRVEHNYE